MTITASMLYNLTVCPHRVSMDRFADPDLRDNVNPFVRMLWERGSTHEQEIVAALAVPFLDLSDYHGAEKERLTTEAMERHEPLIYSGRITADDLVGEPDLLRFSGHGYLAGDIKSGAGEEDKEDLSKPKAHYAVQLALYTDILERKTLSAGRFPFIIDIDAEEFTYDLDSAPGPKSPVLWATYQSVLAKAQAIVARTTETLAAATAAPASSAGGTRPASRRWRRRTT